MIIDCHAGRSDRFHTDSAGANEEVIRFTVRRPKGCYD